MEQLEPLKAAAWMMGAVVSFVAMAVAGRTLLTGMNTFELMLYRSLVGFAIVCLAIARSRAGFSQVRTTHFGLHLKRNAFHYTGQNLWFFAVARSRSASSSRSSSPTRSGWRCSRPSCSARR